VYGLGLREFLMSVSEGDLSSGNLLYLLLGIAALGFVGGGALGMIYSRIATETFQPRQPIKLRPITLVGVGVVVLLLLFGLSAMSPLLSRLSAVLTPTSARLSTTLASDTDGTHWSDPIIVSDLAEESVQTALATADEQIALVWKQDTSGSSPIFYQYGRWNADRQNTEWSSPVAVDQADGQSLPARQLRRANSFL